LSASGQRGSVVEVRVVDQGGELFVEVAIREAGLGRRHDERGDRVGLIHEQGELSHELIVATCELVHGTFTVSMTMSLVAAPAKSSRNRSRQRPRVGPILPTGMSRTSLISA